MVTREKLEPKKQEQKGGQFPEPSASAASQNLRARFVVIHGKKPAYFVPRVKVIFCQFSWYVGPFRTSVGFLVPPSWDGTLS